MRKIYHALLLISFSFMLAGCDLKKDIHIDLADTKPLLVLNAIGDSDEGRLRFEVVQSQPIVGEKTAPSDVGAIQLNLLHGDRLVAKSSTVRLGTLELDLVPGDSYTLEVSSYKHPPVRSTVVVPPTPLFNSVNLDTSHVVTRNNISVFSNSSLSIGMLDNTFFPLALTLTDPPGERNFYLVEAYLQSAELVEGDKLLIALATTDRVLIQDNPDVEATGTLLDPDVSTFVFSQIVVTDQSFSGTTKTLNLLLAIPNLRNIYFEFNHNQPYMYGTIYVRVRQLPDATFRYYRSVVMQHGGVGFFTEPVSIAGNIDGGYGCFSLTSSVTKQASDVKLVNPNYQP